MNTNHDLPASPQALKDRYPYMFAEQNIGFALYRGWFRMFAQLCADIDAVLGKHKRGFHWVQIKEKFGSYRMYYSMEMEGENARLTYEAIEGAGDVTLRPKAKLDSASAPASPAQVVRALVNRAEDATATMCMACGQPAETKSYGGYYLTLRKEHAPAAGLTNSRARWEKLWQSVRFPEDQGGL